MADRGSHTGDGRRYRLRSYRVWDAPTRWFHWINAFLVLALGVVGVAMMTGRAFGVGSEGRDSLERVHVALGLAMALNLLWRFYWAFHAGEYAQWRAILPGGRGYWKGVQAHVYAFLAGHPKHYVGHNPLPRLGVAILLRSPGQWLGRQAIEPTNVGRTAPADLPWAIAGGAVAKLEGIRLLSHTIHLYTFYALGTAVILHVMAVVATELREGGSLVSAMLTGWKYLPGEPKDKNKRRSTAGQEPTPRSMRRHMRPMTNPVEPQRSLDMTEMLFDTALQEGSNWVDTITGKLGTSYKRSGYAALRATLHAIRDSLQLEKAVEFGEQLPILIRGIYYEGWDPKRGSARAAQPSEFMDIVRHDLRGHAELSDAEGTLRASFGALGELLPSEAFEAIVKALSADLGELCQPGTRS